MIFCVPTLSAFYVKRFSVLYIVDFYCVEAKLVIELDGSGHYTKEGKQYDEKRTAFLEEYGLRVVRIINAEIHKNFMGVCEYIDQLVKQSLSQLR